MIKSEDVFVDVERMASGGGVAVALIRANQSYQHDKDDYSALSTLSIEVIKITNELRITKTIHFPSVQFNDLPVAHADLTPSNVVFRLPDIQSMSSNAARQLLGPPTTERQRRIVIPANFKGFIIGNGPHRPRRGLSARSRTPAVPLWCFPPRYAPAFHPPLVRVLAHLLLSMYIAN